MRTLGQVAEKIRSKNAGPFWLTVDIFCRDAASYAAIAEALTHARVAALYGLSEAELLRFEMADLLVVKFSFPRPAIQGSVQDRDMHGASYACLLEEMAF